MQSQKKETAIFILNESTRAVVTHCCSHNLNLSLASSCREPVVDYFFMEAYKSSVILFNTSPKRQGLLEYSYSVRCKSTERRKILVNLCGTRWSERDITYKRFYLAIFLFAYN